MLDTFKRELCDAMMITGVRDIRCVNPRILKKLK